MIRPAVSVVITYSSLDSHFFQSLYNEAVQFSDDVVVVASDHLWNGKPEDLSLLRQGKLASARYRVAIQMWDPHHDGRYWSNHARFLGTRVALHDWVLILDGDEIPDAALMKRFLDSCDFRADGYAFLCYWYFRDPSYRSREKALAGNLMHKRVLTPDYVFSPVERAEYRRCPELSVPENITVDGEPIIHHFSWVRTKDALLRKVASWSHRDDRNWTAIIEEEFSHPFSGTEQVHGFQYDVVPNRFNIQL